MITVAIVGSYDSLKTDSSRIATLNELNIAVEEEKPILLYLYSDNWIICLSAKFVVDELESEFEVMGWQFLRFNARSEEGMNVFRNYEILGTPSMLIINSEGRVVYKRYGFTDKSEILNIYKNL